MSIFLLCSFSYWFIRIPYIFLMSPSLNTCNANVFPQHVICLFTPFSNVVLKKFFNFHLVQLSTFSFVVSAVCIQFEKYLLSWRWLCFLLESFTVLPFTFRSAIHLESVFLYGVRGKLRFFFFFFGPDGYPIGPEWFFLKTTKLTLHTHFLYPFISFSTRSTLKVV